MNNIPLIERFSVWMEVEILGSLTPKDDPGLFFKWLFKIPVLFYKIGLGWMLGKRFLLLTTRGRKTGRLHRTPLEFVHDMHQQAYRVSPGWGGRTDWYRNLRKDPQVIVQFGRHKFAALAELASDAESAHFMQDASSRHPSMDKIWNRWSDQPVDGSWESYLHAAKYFPSVWLKLKKDPGN